MPASRHPDRPSDRSSDRPPLRAVTFDVGGTLLTETPPRYEIYAEAARARGRNLSTRTMERVMRNAHEEVPRRISGAFRYSDAWFRAFIHRIFCQNLGLSPTETAGVAEELFARFEDAETFVVFDGARELLEDLRGRGVKLAVVSNWSERLPNVLAATGLDGHFDTVLCSAIEELEKPDPAIFHRALERLGVDARSAVHVGDHARNDAAAAEVGMGAILIDHAGTGREGTDRLPIVDGFAAVAAELGRRLEA